jgi:hypothetical protein
MNVPSYAMAFTTPAAAVRLEGLEGTEYTEAIVLLRARTFDAVEIEG